MSLFWKRKSICIICLLCVFLICIIAFGFINFIVLPFSSEENITDKDVLEGSFKIFTGKCNNHIILVRYVVPWNPKEDKPHLNASQFVFYAPFNGEALLANPEISAREICYQTVLKAKESCGCLI